MTLLPEDLLLKTSPTWDRAAAKPPQAEQDTATITRITPNRCAKLFTKVSVSTNRNSILLVHQGFWTVTLDDAARRLQGQTAKPSFVDLRFEIGCEAIRMYPPPEIEPSLHFISLTGYWSSARRADLFARLIRIITEAKPRECVFEHEYQGFHSHPNLSLDDRRNRLAPAALKVVERLNQHRRAWRQNALCVI
jgi:hypothetical protein